MEKKKYVKPKLTVAEWDFNEAVCQSQVFCVSDCVRSTVGGYDEDIHYMGRGESNWQKWETNNRVEN